MDQYRTHGTSNISLLSHRNAADSTERSRKVPAEARPAEFIGTALEDSVTHSFRGEPHTQPGGLEHDDQTSCPERFRIAANALTQRERHHITQCASCADVAVLFRDPTETAVARMVRWVRLWIVDWSPTLQIATIVGLIALAIFSLRRDHPSDTPVEPRLATTIPAETAAATATQDDLAIKLSIQVGWPWNTCSVPGPYINRWLGQGQRRIEIEQRLRALDKHQVADPLQRQKAAAFWCQSLSAGTPQLLKLLRAETERLNVPTGATRNAKLSAPLTGEKPQPLSRHARAKLSRTQGISNSSQP